MLRNVSLKDPPPSSDITPTDYLVRSDRTSNPQIIMTMRQILANQQLLGTPWFFLIITFIPCNSLPAAVTFLLTASILQHQVPRWVLIRI